MATLLQHLLENRPPEYPTLYTAINRETKRILMTDELDRAAEFVGGKPGISLQQESFSCLEAIEVIRGNYRLLGYSVDLIVRCSEPPPPVPYWLRWTPPGQ